MPIVVGKASDHARTGLKVLFYGRPKMGKTVLAASAEKVSELRPVLIVDADHGVASLVDMGLGDVIVVSITTVNDLTTVFRFLAERQAEPELIGLPNGTPRFKTVILDSMTEIHRMCLAAARGMENSLPGVMPDTVTRRDFGISLDMILLIVRQFTKLAATGLNVIYTAREKLVTDDSTGAIVQIAPSLPGQAADEVAAYADVVGRMVFTDITKEEKTTRVRALVLSQKSLTAMTGSRFVSVGDVILAPTMSKFMKRLRGTPTKEGGAETEELD